MKTPQQAAGNVSAFKVSAVVPVGGLLWSMLVVTAITLLTGLLSSRGVTDHPPLQIFRQET